MDDNSTEQKADEFTTPSGGPEPTPEEEAAADSSRDDVDLDKVEKNYTDMTEKGKNVKGEGDVDPTT